MATTAAAPRHVMTMAAAGVPGSCCRSASSGGAVTRRPGSSRHSTLNTPIGRALGSNPHVPWTTGLQGPSRLICNLTNDNAELFPPGSDEDPTDPKHMMAMPWADPNTPNPELGDLRSRVPHDWFDLVQDNLQFKEDQEYWFNAPPGGWREQGTTKLEVLKAQPSQIMSCAEHLGPGRMKLSEFKEGQVLTGEITEMSMFHGFQIDLGGEFDGLIPVESKYMWDKLKPECRSVLDITKEISVRIHKIRDPEIYRWPIQLVLESPSVECLHPDNYDPESWRCPKDLRNVNTPEQLEKFFTPEELANATANYFPDMDQYHIWEDHGYNEVYYYQEEHIDGEGLPFDKWVPVPKGKDGKQRIGAFIREGINVAPHSIVFGYDNVHPWEADTSRAGEQEIFEQARDENWSSDQDLVSWE